MVGEEAEAEAVVRVQAGVGAAGPRGGAFFRRGRGGDGAGALLRGAGANGYRFAERQPGLPPVPASSVVAVAALAALIGMSDEGGDVRMRRAQHSQVRSLGRPARGS